MATPFDKVVQEIRVSGYHNHRKEEHSDTVSQGIIDDLTKECAPLRNDFESGRVRTWYRAKSPSARGRKGDALVGEAVERGSPDLDKVRIFIENKSVVTAHRNWSSRFDDLNQAMRDMHSVKPEAILVATVMIGIAQRVLNVPDCVAKKYKRNPKEFEEKVLPRLSKGDERLWDEFDDCISHNTKDSPRKTAERFRMLPIREPGHTHAVGYDYVLLAPIYIDNVNPPYVPFPNDLGINLDDDYKAMLTQICKAYRARWHP